VARHHFTAWLPFDLDLISQCERRAGNDELAGVLSPSLPIVRALWAGLVAAGFVGRRADNSTGWDFGADGYEMGFRAE
jgi:hypothetical protein